MFTKMKRGEWEKHFTFYNLDMFSLFLEMFSQYFNSRMRYDYTRMIISRCHKMLLNYYIPIKENLLFHRKTSKYSHYFLHLINKLLNSSNLALNLGRYIKKQKRDRFSGRKEFQDPERYASTQAWLMIFFCLNKTDIQKTNGSSRMYRCQQRTEEDKCGRTTTRRLQPFKRG